jgi:anti-anti-sigma factor
MVARTDPGRSAVAFAINLELSHGRHGASARIELHEREGGRLALLTLRGWLDGPAVLRLGATLDDLAARGVEQVLLDCAHLNHIDYRRVPALVDALARFESRAGGLVVCGLSHYLRDLFRMAGCESRVRCWPSAAELLLANPFEPRRECAT